MSYVTNVILTCSPLEYEDERIIPEINEWLAAWDNRQLLVDSLAADEAAFRYDHTMMVAGYKSFERPLYLAAFNGIDVEAFLTALRACPWRYPDEVQCLVCDQDDDRFVDRFPVGVAT